MNDPEVTMHDQLIAHCTALQAAGLAIALVRRVPIRLRCLADQVVRSASSVPANLAEGHGRFGRDRIHHWRIAYGSAKEVDSRLRLLAGAGAVDSEAVDVVLDYPPLKRGELRRHSVRAGIREQRSLLD